MALVGARKGLIAFVYGMRPKPRGLHKRRSGQKRRIGLVRAFDAAGRSQLRKLAAEDPVAIQLPFCPSYMGSDKFVGTIASMGG